MDHKIIHKQALALARDYLNTETKLIEVLQLVNREKIYKKMGYASLFSYAVEALNLPSERVYQLNVVAKKCEEVPELKKALDEGVLNVSRARRIVSVIESSTSQDWIEKAANLSQRQLEKEVAKADPKPAIPEKIKALNAEDALISLSISLETQDQLEKLKDILSQKLKKPMNLRCVVEYITQIAMDRLDPVKKAERNVTKSEVPNLSSRIKTRVPIPANLKHHVILRDQNQCTKSTNGRRCESKRWLDIHHIQPISRGGQNTLENLTTLCSSHHRMMHE